LVFYDPGVGTLERSDPWQKLKQALPNIPISDARKLSMRAGNARTAVRQSFIVVRPVA
jgi:hypothetical protein